MTDGKPLFECKGWSFYASGQAYTCDKHTFAKLTHRGRWVVKDGKLGLRTSENPAVLGYRRYDFVAFNEPFQDAYQAYLTGLILDGT